MTSKKRLATPTRAPPCAMTEDASHDRDATYIVATFVAEAGQPRSAVVINPAEMEVSPSADELDIAAHETGLSWRPGGPNSSEGKVSSLGGVAGRQHP